MPNPVTYTAPAGQTSVTWGNGLPAAPVAEFIGTPTSGTTPLAVTFTNQSTGAIDSYLWDFGDGTTSTATNPTKAYLTAASFTVALTATGPGGSNTKTRSGYVVASAPTPGPPPPPPPPPPSGVFGWSIPDVSTLNTGRNTTTQIATNVPAGASFYASPDLLPGQRLELAVNGTTLNLVGDATVPTVDGAAVGSAIDTISARDVVIEVIESPAVATIVNVTRGITYPYGADYTGRVSNPGFGVNRWNAVMTEANAGDIIEVSPGAIQGASSDRNNYYNTLDTSLLSIWKPITLRGMAGRGRWRVYVDRSLAASGCNGITIHSPADIAGRGSFVLSDFEMDNWGQNANSFGIRVRDNATSTSSWTDYHTAVTVRNFKMGKPAYERSASGFAGNAETWTIEDGHVYDTGDGVGASFTGADHNLYIGGRYLYMRGVRSQRSRASNLSGTSHMDGHQAKLTFNFATIEGSVFDCGPDGDSSIQVQMKGGGNLIVRGCLLIAGRNAQTATGNIVFEKEGADTPPGNYGGWTYGLAGHSVLVERNVFVNHRPYVPSSDQRAFVYFRPSGHPWEVTGVSSVTVRDNIGISTVPSSVWIANDPTAGAAWTSRNNTERFYSADERAFNQRDLLLYEDALGAPAASDGSRTIKQWLWPHFGRDVARSTRGLG